MKITILETPERNLHIMVDWYVGKKGVFTPEQAIYLARCILERCGNLPAEIVAGIRVRENLK